MLARAGIYACACKHSGTGVVVSAGVSRTPIDPRITWAVEQMQRRLDQPISIAALAAQVNLSPSRFRHLFKIQVGTGALQYLQRLRLRRARLLIERTFLSVKEVMALVGYNDPSHFSRDFRTLHGVSPSELRGRAMTPSDPGGAASSVIPPTDRRIGPRTGGSAANRSA
jgi:transcriptional regulator GlxA family with amidase domain